MPLSTEKKTIPTILYNRHHKRIPAQLRQIKEAQRFVHQCLVEWNQQLKEEWKLELALEEALTNIIMHSYPDCDGTIELECSINPATAQVTIQIQDDGMPFNPLEDEHDLFAKQPLEQVATNCLGIRLILRAMDSVSYERAGNQNVLTLVKTL